MTGHFCIHLCNLEENLFFSTLILGSVFSDYVVFYGVSSYRRPMRLRATPSATEERHRQSVKGPLRGDVAMLYDTQIQQTGGALIYRYELNNLHSTSRRLA